MKPKVIGLDMYFPEKQDLPEENLLAGATTAPSNDQIFADSIKSRVKRASANFD